MKKVGVANSNLYIAVTIPVLKPDLRGSAG